MNKQRKLTLIIPGNEPGLFERHEIELEVTEDTRFNIGGKVLKCDTNIAEVNTKAYFPKAFCIIAEKVINTKPTINAEVVGEGFNGELLINITDVRYRPKDPMKGTMYAAVELKTYDDGTSRKKYRVTNVKDYTMMFVVYATITRPIVAGATVVLECEA